MTDNWILNLNYKNPASDYINSIGYNSKGEVNIPFTLLEWQKRLEHNLQIIQKLSEQSHLISHLTPLENGGVEVFFNVPMDNSDFVLDNVLIREDADYIYEPPEETNQDRLNYVLNITNNDSSSGSEDELIDNIPDLAVLKSKLSTLITLPFSDSTSSEDD